MSNLRRWQKEVKQSHRPQTQPSQRYRNAQQTGPTARPNSAVVQPLQPVAQFNVPDPILTGSSFTQPQPLIQNYSYSLNPSPTYVPQASPTQQISPYYMVPEPAGSDMNLHLSSAPNQEQAHFGMGQRDPSMNGQQQQRQQQQQQQSQSLDNGSGRRHHMETPQTLTPLTSTFLHYMPFQSDSPVTGKTDHSQQFFVQQQQQQQQQQQFSMVRQQQAPAQSREHNLHISAGEAQSQNQHMLPRSNPGANFAYAGRRVSSPAMVYPYQQLQHVHVPNTVPSHSVHHVSSRSSNPHPPDPGINTGPFVPSVQKQLPITGDSAYTSMFPAARDTGLYQEAGNAPVWSPYPPGMMAPQSAGFPASCQGNPAGIMIGEDGEEEEYTSTMAYDPYVVKHRKRTTPEQLAVLEHAFEETPKPTVNARKLIAEKIDMTPRSVQVWFQNRALGVLRRQKTKILAKKQLEGESADIKDAPDSHPPYLPQNRSEMGPPLVQVVNPSNEHILIEDKGWNQAQIAPPHYGYLRAVEADYNSIDPSGVSASQQQSIGSLGAIKSTPTIGQARRGSLPYPPPGSPNTASSAKPLYTPPGMARAVSNASVPRPHLPLHLAIAMNNGRRASLPNNSQSVSLGHFTPPRIGAKSLNQSTLMSIADDEHLLHPLSGVANGYIASGQDQSLSPKNSDGSGGTTPEAKVERLHEYGPLPNPGFSFGHVDSANQNASSTSISFMSSSDTHIPQLPHNGTVYRDRMGSLASTLSHATTTDDASDSDWERGQQLVTPFMLPDGDHMQAFPGLVPDIRQSEDKGPIVNMRLNAPLRSETRRASA
ncbi:hypothetical protein QFC19_002289 [Naganishia cerealis]|uniref:Uncharacterized protein n=1 Tax=Naganishia cerealis TaxID=610337 RepID=A0ACC2WB01_9TREE|nr:hypothetical protein QFC19_002289 [Naganishia cerealis]